MARYCHILPAAAAALSCLAAGCTTPGAGRPVTPPGAAGAPRTVSDDQRLSGALAEFSAGLLKEGLQDPGAGTNFENAVALYPEAVLPHVRLAAFHLRRGNGDRAAATMREACERNPGSLELRIWAAQTYVLVQTPDLAEKTFREAARDFPDQAQAHLKLADFLDASNRPADARAAIESGIASASDRRPLLRWLGDHYVLKLQDDDPRVNRKEYLRRAIEVFERLESEPEDEMTLRSLQRLGELYLADGRIDEAISCFKRVEACEPDDTSVKKRIAESYVRFDEVDKAIASLTERLNLDPGNPDFRLALGALHERAGDIESAVNSYEGLIGLDPDSPAPYLRLALLYTAFSPEDAVRTIEQALARMPDNLQMMELLAHLHVRNRNPAAALRVFEAMRPLIERAKNPEFSLRFALYFAAISEKCRLYEKAAGLYEKAAELNPGLPEIRAQQAVALFRAGQTNAALGVLQKARATFKDDPSAIFLLAAAYQEANLHDQAMGMYRDLETLGLARGEPAEFLTSEFYFSFGASCERAGRFDEAVRRLLKAIELDPDNAEALNYVAYMWAEKGINIERALEYARRALKIEPESGAFIDTLAWVQYRLGDHARALESVKKAIAFMPDDPTILDHLGDINFVLGDAEAAADAWRRSLAIDPANAGVRAKYSELGFDPGEVPPARPPAPEPEPEEEDEEP